ncbi:hypothetical protein RSSM_02739 [Rhodopirellula sallentina SM41]|uniref:UVR domain-containing protein n=1 Tax=Rhodopirellula sallentina SM41 TaxID=1263870 RepID=M5U2Z2_9BACT|nr:hypothetical protein RSSM_02739 [Rhodopirellula sallentina SM41]
MHCRREQHRKTGAIRLESADIEFSIAHRHCGDHVAINQIRAEIDRLEAEKSRLVDLHDFQSAANVYDAEYAVRTSLDTLLLHGQQNDEP